MGCGGSAKRTPLPGVLSVASWKSGGCHGRQDNVGLLSAIVGVPWSGRLRLGLFWFIHVARTANLASFAASAVPHQAIARYTHVQRGGGCAFASASTYAIPG